MFQFRTGNRKWDCKPIAESVRRDGSQPGCGKIKQRYDRIGRAAGG
jgi:hypothetical protein